MGGAANTIIDCGGADNRAFSFVNGESSWSKLEGFTIKNGDVTGLYLDKNGGLIKICGASPVINDCMFEDGVARQGGAIAIWHSSTTSSPTITNCTFKNDSSTLHGGAIHCARNARPTFEECTFESNFSCQGGAIFLGNGDNINLTVEECLFFDNIAAGGNGGAICVIDSATITSSTFAHNDAGYGSAITITNSAVLTFTRNIVAFNDNEGMRSNDADAEVTLSCNDFYSNTGGSFAS